MSLPWFRLYREWASDPKVQMMPEVMQRRHIMLLCSHGETLHETERAFHWRIDETELTETKALFIEKGFIDEDWNVLNWDRRQFLSDSSTDRVRRHRQAKKQVETLHPHVETFQPVSVTAPEQSRSEQIRSDQKKDAEASPAPALHDGKPLTLPTVSGAEWTVAAKDYVAWAEAYPGINVLAELLKARVWLDANPRNRKTASGMKRFVVSWFSWAQNTSRPSGESNGTNQPSAAKQRINGARSKLAEIAIKRGLVDPFGGNGYSDSPLPLAGSRGVDRGVSAGPRTIGPEILPRQSDRGAGGTQDHSGTDIFSPPR